jgi:hypothetical protein
MMFCPKCKSEWLEGVTICADCGTHLVEYLPEETQSDYDQSVPRELRDLVTFKRFPRQHEAQVARGLLNANGIDAIVSWDDWGRIIPQKYGKSKHGIRLMIKEEDVKRAEDVFREAGVPLEDPPFAEMSERPDPSQSEARNRFLNKLLLFIFILILLITLIQIFYN